MTMNAFSQPAPDLAHLQRWMQTAIAHPAGVEEGVNSTEARKHLDVGLERIQEVLTRSRAQTELERLAIYGSAYYARLIECLREEFPVLLHALGEEIFDGFAVGYLQEYPSQSYTLFKLAAHFPRYLVESCPEPGEDEGGSANWPQFLIDLATLELAFNEVFDGPGSEGVALLDAAQLGGLPAERLPEARLVCVDCLRLHTFRYPVHTYFTAVRRKEEVELPAPAETFLAVTRRDFVVRHYELSRPAYELLSALLAGRPIGEAIQRVADTAGPEIDRLSANLRQWFHDWAAEGFFRAFKLLG
jgi:hypothetical protein